MLQRKAFLADTHIHSMFSQDSESRLADICAAAKAQGIGAVCITDHCDVKPDKIMQQLAQTREAAFAAITQEQKKDNGVELLVGIELACGAYYPEKDIFRIASEKLLSIGHYDCVIGSVHSVGTFPTARSNYGEMTDSELLDSLDRYFDAILAMLEYGEPDVLAHMTYPLRYMNGKYARNLDWRLLESKVCGILKTLIEKNIALEINTSCLDTAYDVWMPDEDIVKKYLQMGGNLLTLGSDAHKPEKVGKGFTQTVQRLKTIGVEKLYYVKNRKFQDYSI